MAEQTPELRTSQSSSGARTARRWWLGLAAIGMVVIALGVDRTAPHSHRQLQSAGSAAQTEAVDSLRIASWNIHRAEGTDGVTDLQRIARDLGSFDLAGLYEVSGGWNSNQSFELAAAIGTQGWWIPTERQWFQDHFGNGLLTRIPLENLSTVPLAGTQGKKFRTAMLARLPLGSKSVSVLAVHIDRDVDRESQLREVIALFESLASPAVLMGDLNTDRDDPQLSRLLHSFDTVDVLDALELESPTDRIDWLIVRGLEVDEAGLVNTGASDHPLIRATVRLPEPP